jgi:hypothetical protein
MSPEEQNKIRDRQRDQYKELELKYKRYDVLARGIGAFAAIASAIAAFVALRGNTELSTVTPELSPTAPAASPASPSEPSRASTLAPSNVAAPSNPEVLQPSPAIIEDDDDYLEDDDD